jgi:hypothetical protein
MDEDLIKYDKYGHITPRHKDDTIWEFEFPKKVSVAFDDVDFTPDADVKVWVQVESPSIIDRSSEIISKKNDFDLILAFSDNILENCENSQKFIFGGVQLDMDSLLLDKKNELSYITTNKNQTSGHKLRHRIWDRYNGQDNINGFTTRFMMTPPRILNKNVIFQNAKFSIAVENMISNGYITEKVIDCFLSKTIPLYYGCPKIGEYFNTDGILQFTTIEELDIHLNNISSEMYGDLVDVVEENYQKAKNYSNYYERVNETINKYINKKLWKKKV